MTHEPDDGSSVPARATADDLSMAPCGYIITDEHGVVVEANAEVVRLTGLRAEELVGRRTLASLMSIGGRMFLETHLLPMLEHDSTVREVALDIVRPDGERVPVLLNANLLGAPGTRALRVVLIETRDRHRYEEDLRQAIRAAEQAREQAAALAQTLQQTLIPPAPPRIPHLDIAAAYRPAGAGSEVGGDFYDIFQVAHESWCVVLGDVSGKGVHAGTVTSLVRYTVRSLAIEHSDPAELLAHLDRALRGDLADHYCTLVLARLDRRAGRWQLRMSLAGHPPPLLKQPGRTFTEFGTPGTPVGLVEEVEFHTVSRTLEHETLLLFTDGVTEARSAEGFFGEQRLTQLLGELPSTPREITDTLTRAAVDYQDGSPRDDIAVVALAPTP